MKYWLLIISSLFMAHSALAELVVIADLGGESTEPYFTAINPQDTIQTESTHMTLQNDSPISRMLPVVTPELSPGQVEPRLLDLPTLPAVFIIGDDELSRTWISKRLDVLQQLNAVGLVVNVETETALTELMQLADGLEILPVSGSDLAQRLQISHYPLLITSTGIEQ